MAAGQRSQVGEVSLGLKLDSSSLDSQARSIESSIGKIGARLGGALVAGLSIKALIGFSKKCLDLGSDLVEVQNVVDVTFTSMNGKINEFAQNAAMQFGLSETMAKRYAGTFGAMSKAFGFAEKDAAEMGMALTGLAGDVASFYNINQDQAYTKLKSVFTGETESLKDLGIVMTQSALDQYALANGFGKTTSAMSEQEKVALRYRFVLSKLNNVSGDFSRTSDSWANQVRILKLQFESLCAVIGQGLITALTPAIKALNAFMGALVKAANTFKSFVYSLFGKTSEDMTAGSAATTGALNDIAAGAGDAAGSLSDVGDAAQGAGSDVSNAANQIRRSLASFDQITKLTDQSASESSGGNGSGSGSGSGSGAGVGGLGDTASALQNTAYDVADENGPLSKIFNRLKEIGNLAKEGFWDGFGDMGVFESIKDNLASIGNSLKNIFTDNDVVEAANTYVDKLAYNFSKVAGAFASIGATIADNLTGGIAKYLEDNIDRIKGFFVRMFNIEGEIADLVGNFTAAFADVFSVFRSEDAKQITADLISLFTETFGGVTELIAKVVRDWIDLITTPFTENADKIKNAIESTLGPVRSVMDTIADAFKHAWDVVQKVYDEHVQPLFQSIRDTFSTVVGILADGYTEYIAPVLDRLAEKFEDVVGKHVKPMLDNLGELLGSVFDLLKTVWENILSPLFAWIASNVMPILAPIAEFIGETLLAVLRTISDILSTIFNTAKNVIDKISEVIGKFNLFNGKEATGTVGIKKSSSWNADAWTVLSLILTPVAPGAIIIETALKKASTWVADAWTAIKSAGSTIKAILEVAVKKASTWVNDAWAALKKTGSNVKATVNVAVNKASTWVADAWTAAKMTGGKITRKVESAVQKSSTWIADAWTAAKIKAATVRKTLMQSVMKGSWVADAWKAFNAEGKTVYRKLAQTVQKNFWNSDAWSAARLRAETIRKILYANVMRGSYWVSDAWNVFKAKAGSVRRALYQYLLRGNNWSASLLKAALITGGTVRRTVRIGIEWFGKKVSAAWKVLTGRAKGGIFRAGIWRPVQSYAGGGNPPGGQIFRARENGNPELVGTIKGSTAVMNNDQIVASVSHGVAQAIKGIRFYSKDRATPHLAMVSDMIRSDTSELARYAKKASEASHGGGTKEILDVLREILKYLQTADFDVYLDGKSVKDRIVSLINADTMATGRAAFII